MSRNVPVCLITKKLQPLRPAAKTLPMHDFPTLGELMESPNPDIRLRAIRTALTCSTKLNELRKLGDDVQALSDALYINNH